MKYLFAFLMMLSLKGFTQSKDETQVAQAVEALRKAMVDPTPASLNALLTDELSYGHSNGLIQDKKAFMEALLSGQSDFVSIELTDQTIKIHGKTAIVRHILTGVTNDNNKPGNVRLAVLTVWVKEQGRWKLIARQAVRAA